MMLLIMEVAQNLGIVAQKAIAVVQNTLVFEQAQADDCATTKFSMIWVSMGFPRFSCFS